VAPTSAASAAGAAEPATRWGDREGRRRDILAAARSQLSTGGYLGLNMREIARGAGVCPGTVYAYFATKDEIFATLYAEAIGHHNRRVAPICAEATHLAPLLSDLATAYLDLYATYGRSFTVWSVLHDEGKPGSHDLPPELLATLRRAALDHGELVLDGIRAAAAAEGRTLVDEPYIMSFVWMVLTGMAENLTGERRHLRAGTRAELIAHAARTVAAGITV